MGRPHQQPDHLADVDPQGTDPVRPEPSGGWSRRWTASVLAGAVVVAAVAGAVVLPNGGDDGDRTVTGEHATAVASTPTSMPANSATVMVAVVYGQASIAGEPADLLLAFVDGDGDVVAERRWSEVEEPVDTSPGEVVVMGGLVQGVPAGAMRLAVTLVRGDEPVACEQSFTAETGNPVILRIQLGVDLGPAADPACADIQPVADWIQGRTSTTGAAYVGLSEADATARAEADGLTTRVVGVDGMDLVVTMDLRPDRLDLVVFDGIVVAAQLPTEPALGTPA